MSDLHLGHANIIRYCSRPFLPTAVDEMNAVLISNWNATIGPDTRVFYLGDLRYGKGSKPADHYREHLAGAITYILGNHDDAPLPGAVKSTEFTYNGIRFFLVHDPADAPPAWDGWVIHGHHHNNDLVRYPFMNFIDRRVNVSAEVVGYSPVSLEEIVSLIHERRKNGDRSPVLLRHPPHIQVRE
ncbi:MAG: hypothetical protein GYA23_09575 [Methanomicrobiales archaeon]|nr:hypothetical protein [Methanomicrobiales archaeon]